MRKERGFTLIEIIAVLVILGILAAVAIPKYNTVQRQARSSALQGAYAAGQSQLAMQHASDVMNGDSPSTWTNTQTGVVLGDFTMTLNGACGQDASSVTVTARDGNAVVAADYADGETFTDSFTICTP